LKAMGLTGAAALVGQTAKAKTMDKKPNIILCMTDDQGWGDTGYNGHPVVKTPNLDEMAKTGLRFDRFYAAAPVCSPTRASCLMGRNPYRTGVFTANKGILRPEEFTLMKFLKAKGYTTGHFGKWHLGTLTTKERDSNRGKPGNDAEYNPPWEHNFDTCFSTEAKVPTWDPMKKPPKASKQGWKALSQDDEHKPYGTYYWDEKGRKVTDNLEGDDSRVIMDRALPFIQSAAKSETPFLAVIWFHAPHLPCVASPKLFEYYKGKGMTDRAASFYGSITGVDEQMGRLRQELKKLNVADNTMLWYCADNGPEGEASPDTGTAGPYRGRKRDLYEGGVRVPGLLVWPDQVKKGRKTDTACVTSDYLPTIRAVLGESYTERPLDGESILPLIKNKPFTRKKTIGFKFNDRCAWNQDQYKLYSDKRGANVELYDLKNDPSEKTDLAADRPDMVKQMQAEYGNWEGSVKESFEGKEYGRKSFDRLKQKWPGEKRSEARGRESKVGERDE
jgi:arylsulfatase A-like enzyme